MNSLRFLLPFLILLSFNSSALAKSCLTLKELDKISSECSDNHHYIKAGQKCLKALEGFISQVTHTPMKQLTKKTKSKLSAKNLEAIRSKAKEAQKKVNIYRNNIFYPEDSDAPEELIGDGIKFINSHDCYSQANNGLKKISEKVDSYVKLFNP